MKEVELTIFEKKKVGNDIFLMKLVGDCSAIKRSGEFINIALPNYYLRRPISVFDFDKDSVTILFKVLGNGTKDLSEYEIGYKLNILINLGNGFDLKLYDKPLLVAGGIGIAPLVSVAKYYMKNGIKPTLIYGTAKSSDLVLIDELKSISNLIICTDDGSMGYQGNPVQYLKENEISFDYYYACGPQKMLMYLSQYSSQGEVSLEARMGCGFGACMGCSIETVSGPKRVCKEGPVFKASEVIFK